MSRRFRGGFVHKVDAKGRVSVPSSFVRNVIEGDPDSDGGRGTVILIWDKEFMPCIEGYTVNGIDDVYEEIEALPRYSDPRRALELSMMGDSGEFEIDDNGRMGLKHLRDLYDIGDEVRFVGMGQRFEIWVPEAFEAARHEARAAVGGDPRKLLEQKKPKENVVRLVTDSTDE